MKRKPSLSSLKRKKLPSLAKLKRDLDKKFSLFIRRRDANESGHGLCITCGEFRLLQAGHFVPRQYLATRWLETNAHGQCAMCNCWGHGEQAEYYRSLVRKYGKVVPDGLLLMKHTTVHMKRQDYETLIERYSQ